MKKGTEPTRAKPARNEAIRNVTIMFANALSSADAEGGRLRRNVRPRRVEQGADGNALYRKRYSLQSKHLELSAKTNIDYHLPSDYCLDDRVCFCGWHFQILEYRNAKIPNLIMARLI